METPKMLLFILSISICANIHASNYQLTTKALTVASSGGEKYFNLTCDTTWKLTSKQDWISISPVSGDSGTFTVTVKVTASEHHAERKGITSLAIANRVIEIPLSQVDERNYWKDGELISLHQSKNLPDGRLPIPLAIIGDGWDLSDLKKGGLWQTFSQALCDLFLQIDVVKDFKDYFDIYAYCAESSQRGKYGFNAFGTTPTIGTDFRKMRRLIDDAMKNHPNKSALTFMSASNGAVGGWASLEGYAFASNPDNDKGYTYWMAHEFVGHAFARLPDFYPCWDCDGYFTCKTIDRGGAQENDTITHRGGTFPKCYTNGDCNVKRFVERTYSEWRKGFEWNVDWETDPQKVIWKDFIGKPGYDNVGVYPTEFNDWGEYDSWFYGLTAPEKDDCMNTSGDYIWFNVGTRMWLWNRILQLSGVPDPDILREHADPAHPRSLENFMRFDTLHHYNNNGHNTHLPVEHPVLMKKYWEENGLYP